MAMDATLKDRVVVLGLGGGGGRVVAAMADLTLAADAVALGAADTDPKALASLAGVVQIPLGGGWTGNASAGDSAALGEKAAIASLDDLKQFVADAAIVIVVAGLGKGTGSGAARVVARHLRRAGKTSLFVVTLPFSFEGSWRCSLAQKDLEELRRTTAAVLAIPNDLLFSTMPADMVAAEAFAVANQLLAADLTGLIRMTRAGALLSVDFVTLRNLLKEKPSLCTLGFGRAAGDGRCEEAVEQFLTCPFLGGEESVSRTDAAVLTLIGGPRLTKGEIESCFDRLKAAFPSTARLYNGAFVDPALGDELHLTGMLCRFGGPGDGEPDATPPPRGRMHQPPGPGGETQGVLDLVEQSAGIFANCPPTVRNGENLDIPTWQRRGIKIELDG
ncbi:MAG: hypothetical protein WC789_09040 [Lentisphaeria bacterium]|jgi:cell division protein FtsZ